MSAIESIDTIQDKLLSLTDEKVRTWVAQHSAQFTLEILEALRKRAQGISEQGDLDTAQHLLDRMVYVAKVLEHPLGMAVVWKGRANVLQRYEHYEESLQATDAAVEIYEKHGTEFEVAMARNNAVYPLGALERFDEAIEVALWVRERFARQDTAWGKYCLAHISANLAAIYVQAWQPEKALEAQQCALNLYQELGETDKVAWTLQDLGLTAYRMDRLNLAQKYYEQAYATLLASQHTPRLIKIHYNLSKIFIRKGEYEKALEHLQQAREKLAKSQKISNLSDPAFVDLIESEVRRRLNQPQKAEKLLRRALQKFEQKGLQLEATRVLPELSKLLAANNTPDKLAEGLSCLEKAEAYLQDLKVPLLMAWVQLEYGEFLLRLERVPSAEPRAEMAQDIFAEVGLPLRRAQADVLLADCYQNSDPAQAQQLYESVLDVTGQNLPTLAARCWHGLGRLAMSKGDISATKQAYENAINLLDTVRRALRGHSHQAGFLEDKQKLVAELLAALHSQLGQEYTIFTWVEWFKARVLADLLAGQPLDDSSSPKLIRLHKRLDHMRRKLDFLESSLLSSKENPLGEKQQRGTALAAHDAHQVRELCETQEQLRALKEQLARLNDDAYKWREGQPVDPHFIHALLDDQTLFISYYTAGDQLYALTATHLEGDIQIHALHISTNIVESRWRQISRLVTHASSRLSAVQTRLARLWKYLIAPLEHRMLNKTRLLISPYRALSNIPFAGLYDKQSQQYLVERWTIQLSPSATILEQCRRRPKATQLPLLVGYPGQPDQPAYLPGVKQEIQTLANLLPEATLLSDKQATFENVLSAMPGRSFILIAGHIVYDSAHPLESGIPLSGGKWLRATDLYMHYGYLDGAMLVLSGCSSGRGQPAGGDVLGLTSAFLYAGAVGIVAGLWAIDDSATAALITKFYQELKLGQDTASALRAAQVALLNSEQHSHPYFWAPFVLSGDSRTL